MNQLKKSQSLNDISPHYPLQYYNQDNGHGSVKNNLYFLNESMMDDDMADENEYIDDRFNGVITLNDRSARFSKPDNTILEEEGGNIDNRKSFDEYEEEVDSILASRKKINKTHMTRRMKPLITHNTRNKQIPDDQISYATIPRAVKRGKTRKPLLDDHKKFHEEDKINC
ncbi:unnamed protein product [Gordionus sp. m RMFG-2023]